MKLNTDNVEMSPDKFVMELNSYLTISDNVEIVLHGTNKNEYIYSVDVRKIKSTRPASIYVVNWNRCQFEFTNVECGADDNNIIKIGTAYGSNFTIRTSPLDRNTWNIVSQILCTIS